jgi:hypothetical protein
VFVCVVAWQVAVATGDQLVLVLDGVGFNGARGSYKLSWSMRGVYSSQ